jgi:hypothetical protein
MSRTACTLATICGALALPLFAPVAATAQDEPAMLDLTAAYESAARRAARNDISGAIRGFREVIAQDPFWSDAVYNIAHLSEHVESWADCALYFRRYLALEPGDAEEIGPRIERCERRIDGGGTLTVPSTSPEGIPVVVDGLALGPAPLGPIMLAAGEHTVAAERTDYEPFSTTVTIAADGAIELPISLVAVTYYGTVRLDVLQPDAIILLDGTSIATSPMTEPMRLAAGQYLFEIVKEGYHPWRRQIEVRRDDAQVHAVELIDERIDLDDL